MLDGEDVLRWTCRDELSKRRSDGGQLRRRQCQFAGPMFAVSVDAVANLRDLARRPARKATMVVGERIIHELRGSSCLPLDPLPALRKACAVTRSLSGRVEDRATIEQAVAAHATRLNEKLRREGCGGDEITVFYHTSEHDRGASMRSASTTVMPPEATSDSLVPIHGHSSASQRPGARRWATGRGADGTARSSRRT